LARGRVRSCALAAFENKMSAGLLPKPAAYIGGFFVARRRVPRVFRREDEPEVGVSDDCNNAMETQKP